MAGFLKRLFKFGKKKEDENADVQEVEDVASDAVDNSEELALEQERIKAEQAAADAEKLRQEREAAEAQAALEETRAREQMAQEEAERKAAEAAAAKAEKEAQEKVERDKAAQEKAEQEQAAKELAVQEQAAEEQAIKERVAKELAAQEQEAKEQKIKEQAEREEAERLAAEALAQKQEAERLEAEAAAEAKAAADAEAQRLAEQEEQEEQEERRLAAEREEAERLALEQEKNSTEPPAVENDDVIDDSAETLVDVETETQEPLSEAPEPAPVKKSWLARLKGGLSRSSSQLTENITAVFTKKKLDEDTLQELEDILIQADLGVETAMNVTDKLAQQRMGKDVSDEEVREFMAAEIETVLDPVAAELELDLDHTPHVILVVGVNGSGKTTTIGKLSQKLYDAGFSTLLVAGDTFRAAAIEQLKIWGDRTQSPVVSRPLGSDAAGLAYDAYALAKEEGRDVMLMDTAGRLQNKTELMDELEKIIRVLKKQDPEAPHTVLLTLDATTGQNALNQVDIFKDVSGVNGLVMTKLDGTARGGILVSISAKHKLPVYFLGVGEAVDDLEPFEAKDFARSIAGLS